MSYPPTVLIDISLILHCSQMCLLFGKPETAPGLPDEWGFLFRELPKDTSVHVFNGLRIVAPNRLYFLTVERAFNSNTAPPSRRDLDAAAFYNYVGLKGLVDPKYRDKAPFARDGVEYSNELEVNSRCFARFTNGSYYWGQIAAKNCAGSTTTYAVQFDDGDFLPRIESHFVYSVKAAVHAGETPPAHLGNSPEYLGLLDLHSQRCKTCAMCVKVDCGRCRVCRSNAETTSPRRQACLLKGRLDCFELSCCHLFLFPYRLLFFSFAGVPA